MAAVTAYAHALAAEADRQGVALGEPRFDDDAYEAKLDLVTRERVPARLLHLRRPAPDTVARSTPATSPCRATVTNAAEAREAADAGADALVAQGTEAGGHRGYFRDDGERRSTGCSRCCASCAPRPTCR